MAKSGRLEQGDNIYRHYRFNLFPEMTYYVSSGTLNLAQLNPTPYSTTVASKAIEFGEKRKIRAITPFKVIQGHQGRYQSKARMRLPISD